MRAFISARLRAASLLVVLAGAACAPVQTEAPALRQPASCAVTLADDLPGTFGQGTLVLDAASGRHPLRLLVDTGASGGGALGAEAAGRLGLVPEPGGASVVTVAGLMMRSQRVRVPALRIGRLPPVPASMAVMPAEASSILASRADGILGAGVLSRHDIEIDPEAGRIRFHAVAGCSGGLVPFAEPHQALPLRFGPFEQIYVHVRIDGTELLALVDTGFNGTLLVLGSAAQRLGLGAASEDDLARGAARDFTGQRVPLSVRRVGSVEIGGFVARDAPVMVMAPPANGPPPFVQADALLGGGFLLTRRVWISYATGRLYVADRPAGGR